MDVNEDILMEVRLQFRNGKCREQEFVGGMASCVEYAEDAAGKFRQEGWTVQHDPATCEWYLSKPGQPDFELVIGDCDMDASDVPAE
jgi:hypothetical protein